MLPSRAPIGRARRAGAYRVGQSRGALGRPAVTAAPSTCSASASATTFALRQGGDRLGGLQRPVLAVLAVGVDDGGGPHRVEHRVDRVAHRVGGVDPVAAQQRAGVGDHDHPADQRAEETRRDVPHQPRGDRRGDQATDEQPERPDGVDALRAEGEEEAEARRQRDEELRGVDRADHLARLHAPAGQDRRRADRAPAAAAGRVDEAGDAGRAGRGSACASACRGAGGRSRGG